ncbi:glycosyltransferase family 4 protein [Foetidibacter luteolus]|uniref:glycosyltransferase family 4 protein n=1 Tax=Foetidibacter luteolus TaxID=2608880 RepID=UPI00129B8ABE|nr:glycosyltransferase family 4 protein [Foetidibacter luteolus]
MKQNSRILIIASEFPPGTGGIGNHAYNLALSFAQQGFDVSVIADIVGANEEDIRRFAASQPFRLVAITRKSFVFFTYMQRINYAIKQARRQDYIICSGKFSLWLINILRLLYRHQKIIAIVHGSELDLKSNRGKRWVAAALLKSSAVVSVSSYTSTHIPAAVLEEVPCFIIPNGINLQEFQPVPVAKAEGERLNLVTIGSMTERKGQENVIKAMPDILRQFPQAVYHIIGRPYRKQQLQQLAASLNVSGSIVFHDELSRDELLRQLAQCHIKLMLSNHTKEGDFEGFGIAILEANAMSVPAIGSNFGGITDAIVQGKTGRLVNPYEPGEISAAISDIVNSYAMYATDARAWAQQHDWKLIITRYVELLDTI